MPSAPCAGAASEPCMHGLQALMAILHAWATGSASTGIWSLHGACLHAVALLQGAHAFRLLPSRGPAGFPACIRRRLATCAAALRRRWPAAFMMARCRACMLHGHMYTIRRPAQVLHQRQAHRQRLQVRRARPQGRAHAALPCISCMHGMHVYACMDRPQRLKKAPLIPRLKKAPLIHACCARGALKAAGVLGHGRYRHPLLYRVGVW